MSEREEYSYSSEMWPLLTTLAQVNTPRLLQAISIKWNEVGSSQRKKKDKSQTAVLALFFVAVINH